jgi:uncharacterized protein YgiM (DUF1202 family)
LPAGANGDPPYTYTVPVLPSGLDFDDQTRFISGTPDTPGMTNVTYTVTDDDGDPISTDFKITVYPMPSLVDVSDLSFMQGELYTVVLPEATGGRPQFVYSASPLPTGLKFITSTRTITGTPTAIETVNVTYEATDKDGDKASVTFEIDVSVDPMPHLDSVTDFTATKGTQFYTQLPEASGGNAPLAYSAPGLPAGLRFITNTRVITGTPTQMEVATVTYTVADTDNDQDSVTFKITVNEPDQGVQGGTKQVNNNGGGNQGGGTQRPPAVTLGDTTGFTLKVGEPFTQQLPAANGGTPPYEYRVTTPPAGLTFNRGSHTLSGTPTAPGTTTLIYTVTDANNIGASDDFTITVSAAVLSLGDITGFSATIGELFTQQLPAASGGSSPYAYMVTDLPSGLSFLEITRTITGTPTMAETKVVTYTVADSEFSSASDNFTITVGEGQSGQQGGTGNGGKSDGGGGGGGGGGKSNSGDSGNSGNRQRYVPPAPSPLPSQRQSAPTPVPVAITTPYLMNVRSGPGLDYEVVTTVPEGTRASIYGRDPLDDWFQVQIEGIDGMVWIYQDLTTVEGSLDGVRFLEQWEIDLIARPGDGPLAITTPDILNVRSGPGLDYDILTTVPQGTQAKIIGLSPDREWYKVELGVLDQPAWVYAGLTTLVGSLVGVKQYTLAELDGTDTGGDKPLAITVPTIMNVRSGPGTEYEVVTTVPQGTQAEIIGIGPQNQWYYVELSTLDDPAWIFQDLTTLIGSLAGVRQIASWQVGQPSTDSEVDRPLAVTYPSLVNVREGPGDEYGVLIAIGQGTRVRIYGVDPDEDWYLIEVDGLDQLGWISENLTVLVGDLDGVKRITAEEIAMLPVAIAQTAVLNVRSGPSTSHGVVTTLSQGTWSEILGVDTQSQWFKIKVDGITGQAWVLRDLTRLAGSLSGVEQIAADANPPPTTAASPPSASPPPAVSSITIDLTLPSDGRINLEVNWADAGACAQVYKLYYRSNTDSPTYFSLETAVTSSTASSKNLSFQTLPANSFISAWCGTSSAGRQVAEVQVDATSAGTYSSLPYHPSSGAVAVAPLK